MKIIGGGCRPLEIAAFLYSQHLGNAASNQIKRGWSRPYLTFLLYIYRDE